MTLCNVYRPTTDNSNFFFTLFKQLNDFTFSEIVMGENFNVILNHTLDKENGPNHSNKPARDDLLSHMRLLNIKDVFQEINPTEKQFTRFNCNPFTATRLDFFLISDEVLGHVKSFDIKHGVMSDHKMVIINLNLHDNKRGAGYWKMNANILNDEDFVQTTGQVIHDYQLTNPMSHVSPHVRWEAFKCVIRGHVISYCYAKSNTYRNSQNHLEALIAQKEKSLINHYSDITALQLTDLKKEYDTIAQKKTEGTIIRSRARWTEFGEKNTKYFLNLEKRQQQRNIIKELQTTKNTLKNPKLILKELTSFYKQLYSDINDVPTNDMINYIDSMNLPNIKKKNENNF